MDMSPQEYQAYVKGMQKKSPLLKDMALAFGIGGAICVVGQLIQTGWLMLLPLVWEIGELLSSFMAYTAIRNVSDQMLTIVMMILMAPFLLAHARILSGVGVEKGLRQLLFFGPAFALFAIAVPGGMIAAALAGKTVALGLSPVSAVFYFLSGLYAAVLCLSLRRFAR